MKTLYLECSMGAAGDMLAAALLELHPAPADVIARLNRIGLPGVAFSMRPVSKCSINGTHFCVTVNGVEEGSLDHSHGHEGHTHEECAQHEAHEHHGEHGHHEHHGLHEIEHIVSHLDLPGAVREDVLAVYRLIAQAEGEVHGRPVDQVHFHEVGALDAVADVAAVCLLLHELAPQQICASPVHVGGGQVRCAHGILPVPAPATALLLRGIPSYGGSVSGELCTPTGAALLRHFVRTFGPQPVMRVDALGYGMGKKDFDQANCVRAMLGQTEQQRESVAELSCNLDDMTPEAVGFAMERLLSAGALDVYTIPIGMKKNRPGVLLTCMCRMEQREEMLRLLFLHTTTLGVRESVSGRYTLQRTVEAAEGPCGTVHVKRSEGWGVCREKMEYEDLARIARERGVSLEQAARMAGGPVSHRSAPEG